MDKKIFARLSIEDKEIIKKMTYDGKSLRNISKETGLGVTTIYYHVRKIKPKQKKEFVNYLSDFHVGELVGAFAGDGSYYHQKYVHSLRNSSQHRVRYHLSLKTDKDYGEYLSSILRSCSLNPFAITQKDFGKLDILINSKEFIEFIKKYLTWEIKKTLTIRLSNKPINYSKNFIRGFARGLMDTDGYVEVSNVSCACISRKLINNLTTIFDLLGIYYKFSKKVSKGKKDLYLVRVYRQSLERYFEEIGFSNKYKKIALCKILEGNRKD